MAARRDLPLQVMTETEVSLLKKIDNLRKYIREELGPATPADCEWYTEFPDDVRRYLVCYIADCVFRFLAYEGDLTKVFTTDGFDVFFVFIIMEERVCVSKAKTEAEYFRLLTNRTLRLNVLVHEEKKATLWNANDPILLPSEPLRQLTKRHLLASDRSGSKPKAKLKNTQNLILRGVDKAKKDKNNEITPVFRAVQEGRQPSHKLADSFEARQKKLSDAIRHIAGYTIAPEAYVVHLFALTVLFIPENQDDLDNVRQFLRKQQELTGPDHEDAATAEACLACQDFIDSLPKFMPEPLVTYISATILKEIDSRKETSDTSDGQDSFERIPEENDTEESDARIVFFNVGKASYVSAVQLDEESNGIANPSEDSLDDDELEEAIIRGCTPGTTYVFDAKTAVDEKPVACVCRVLRYLPLLPDLEQHTYQVL